MTRLRRLLTESDAPILTAELPAAATMGALYAHVARLAEHVTVINATDNAAARAHPSNLALALAIRHAGAEPVLQVVCRDKNRLALQADLLGAALHGVTNVCCLTGDDVTAGDEPQSRRVFDLDAPQLLRTATALSNGRTLSGRTVDPAPDLFLGAVENPGAPPYEHRVRRARLKAASGARFLQLQICYHPERLEAFCSLAAKVGLHRTTAMLATVCLVRGARALRYMDAHVPGIEVPEPVLRRVETAADPAEEAYRLAVDQARHALEQPGVRGVHLVDFRHDDSVARLRHDLGIPAPHAQPSQALAT